MASDIIWSAIVCGWFGTQLPTASITVDTNLQAIGNTWGVTSNTSADSGFFPVKMVDSSLPDGIAYFQSSAGDSSAVCRLTIDLLIERNITSMLLFPMGATPTSYSMAGADASAVVGPITYPVELLPGM
ncbi:hypothetical protein Pelo_18373 [Pelomyxa schiedti]|nr:hypothetical protein Pelo_18373 [Pelomyxa schiedti]